MRAQLISFYSDPPYTAYYTSCAQRLECRCNELGIDCRIEEVECGPRVTWMQRTNIKAAYIMRCLRTATRPLLWVDVDSTIHACPDALDALQCDVAAATFDGAAHGSPLLTIRASVLYFAPSQAAREFVASWYALSASGGRPDHQWLQYAWNQSQRLPDIAMGVLGEEYAYHRPTAIDKTLRPIIEIGISNVRQKREELGQTK